MKTEAEYRMDILKEALKIKENNEKIERIPAELIAKGIEPYSFIIWDELGIEEVEA